MNPESALNSRAPHELEYVQPALDPFTQAFQLGDWLVEPRLNQLQQLDGGTSKHLEPRLAKLLCYLASHPLEVVDRDTLVSVLWPRVIVNENSLTRAVSELRKLLAHESNPSQVYIETIPKRGYRLRMPVQASKISTTPPSPTPAVDLWQTPAAWQQLRQSAVAACSLALILAFLLQGYESMENNNDSFPAFPLGDELVYSAAEQQLRDEVVLSSAVSGGDASGVNTNNKTEAVVSQDGDRFAYIQYDQKGSTLFLGEVESSFDPVPIFNSSDKLYNLAWSPLQDALLFAGKSTLTTTTLYGREINDQAKLYSFDLESFRLSLLVEEVPTTLPASKSELSLT